MKAALATHSFKVCNLHLGYRYILYEWNIWTHKAVWFLMFPAPTVVAINRSHINLVEFILIYKLPSSGQQMPFFPTRTYSYKYSCTWLCHECANIAKWRNAYMLVCTCIAMCCVCMCVCVVCVCCVCACVCTCVCICYNAWLKICSYINSPTLWQMVTPST